MLAVKKFYCSEEEFRGIHENLKQTACPHCKAVGTLILHGILCGYDENHHQRKSIRARRIFCNNRKACKNGCGRTHSIWLADKIKRLSLTAISLWRFVTLVVAGSSKLQAMRELNCTLSDSAPYRIWKRFEMAQSRIRTALANLCRAPRVESEQPTAQVVAHLQAAFPGQDCPVVAFQVAAQDFFL
jgi:hypothetical protein